MSADDLSEPDDQLLGLDAQVVEGQEEKSPLTNENERQNLGRESRMGVRDTFPDDVARE